MFGCNKNNQSFVDQYRKEVHLNIPIGYYKLDSYRPIKLQNLHQKQGATFLLTALTIIVVTPFIRTEFHLVDQVMANGWAQLPDILYGMVLDCQGSLNSAQWTFKSIYILLAIILIFAVHELIHYGFCWVFTERRPELDHRGVASLVTYLPPRTYLCQRQALIAVIMPLVIISIGVVVGWRFIPLDMLQYLLIAGVFHTAGAVSDVFQFNRWRKEPDDILISTGKNFTGIYKPKGEADYCTCNI